MPDGRSQITDDFAKLCEIVAKLRAPDGCPWDREQTNQSLLPALIEEAYEAAEAARAQDEAHFCEELGDLLLLVVMHAQIACETGKFDIEDVIEEVSNKLIRRHPHVFGTSKARDAGAVLKQWEAIKREEKTSRVCQRPCPRWSAPRRPNPKPPGLISTGQNCATSSLKWKKSWGKPKKRSGHERKTGSKTRLGICCSPS